MSRPARRRCLVCYETTEEGTDYHRRCSRRLFGADEPPLLDVASDDVERLALDLVNRRLAVTGVQRKLSLSLIPSESRGGRPRLTIVGVLGGTHILKPPAPEYPHMPEVEDATMALAAICGVEAAPHGLVRMKDGALGYLTRRFDREAGRKIAVEDLCQLSGKPTSGKYRSSAERAGKVIRRFSSNPGDDALRYFELTLFSFATGNADMHLKNFSLLTREDGIVRLSPAYDLLATRLLVPASEDPEELALPANGRKAKLGRMDFLALGANLAIPPIVVERTLARFASASRRMAAHLAKSFLPAAMQRGYRTLIGERLGRIAAR